MTARTQRNIAWQATKAKIQQQREEKEQKLRDEQMRIQREQQEKEQRLRDEHLKIQKEQQAFDLEQMKLQAESEREEREAILKLTLASIQAKKDVLETFEEERSQKSSSISIGVTEVAPLEKVAAYVGGLPDTVNEPVVQETKIPGIDPLDRAANLVGELFKLEFAASKVKPEFEIPKKSVKSIARSKTSLQKSKERKEFLPGVKGVNDPINIKSVPLVFKSETVPMYTKPTTNLHYAWSTQPIPAPFQPNLPVRTL